MAGVTVSGVLWAIFQNNAGGAWDNAKKSFEAGVLIDGEMTYKGSEAHKAAITGDTVGDPFKDTSGPSMNILIKLTCLIGLVIAPILGDHSVDDLPNLPEESGMVQTSEFNSPSNGEQAISKEIQVKMTTEGEQTVASVRVTTMKNGKSDVQVKTFKGSEAEVKAQIENL